MSAVVPPDVLIVGAGSAGAALAARLSERASRSVLLLDAGVGAPHGSAVSDASTLPAADSRWVRRYDAQLAPGRAARLTRGRVLGGSSAVNGAYFIRGTPSDFEGWAARGNDRWSYESVLAAFVRMECDLDYGTESFHGDAGPVPVSRGLDGPLHAVTEAFFESCSRDGHRPEPDKNAGGTAGYGLVPRNVVEGRRVNSAMAYLDPIRDRANLTIRAGRAVTRVLFDGDEAIGVVLAERDGAERDGATSERLLAGQVVLCAGAIGSAQLLLASGIGPAADLAALGIDVVHDAPGVGTRCSDHPAIELRYLPSDRSDGRIAPVQGALHTELSSGRTLEVLATRRSYGRATGDDPDDTALSLRLSLMQPRSRGRLRLRSSDPSADPIIELGYLADAEDRGDLSEALRIGVGLLDEMERAGVVDRGLGPDRSELRSDVALDRWIRHHLDTSMHLSGTAPMGPSSDPFAVVDQRCRVHGVDRLRVVDTSIMPTVTSRGPAATAVMIGEHATTSFD